MPLHEVIAARRDEVLQRWKVDVQGTLAPDAMPSLELIDHIPEFLDEIVAVLRADTGGESSSPSLENSRIAAGHGAQRLRLGFSLDAVVREYGPLRDAIVATAREAGDPPSFRELHVLFDCIIGGIAHAVAEYAHQRDAELLRQANQHFAFIAHELRNPLAAATTAFQLLKTRGQLPAESRSVNALERGLRRTSELIDHTLRLVRMASGVELQRTSTTLADLFADVELGATSEAEAKHVELRITIAQDEAIDVDVRLMRSAIGNLVRNAVKYTAPGSLVELRGTVAHGRATIEIEDTCGGLPPEKVMQAFAPFVRLAQAEDGFGLGLAIVKQASDAHGGSVRVQNVPGKGCIFVLEIPASSEPLVASGERAADAVSPP